jgi:hypothetical protein
MYVLVCDQLTFHSDGNRTLTKMLIPAGHMTHIPRCINKKRYEMKYEQGDKSVMSKQVKARNGESGRRNVGRTVYRTAMTGLRDIP